MENGSQHSNSWVNFIYGTFLASLLMTGAGIFFLDADLWAKGYMAMGCVMNVVLAISITKTIRDNQDADRQEAFLRRHEK